MLELFEYGRNFDRNESETTTTAAVAQKREKCNQESLINLSKSRHTALLTNVYHTNWIVRATKSQRARQNRIDGMEIFAMNL